MSERIVKDYASTVGYLVPVLSNKYFNLFILNSDVTKQYAYIYLSVYVWSAPKNNFL